MVLIRAQDALNKDSFIVKNADGEILTSNAYKGVLPCVEMPVSTDTTIHIAFRCVNSSECHKKFLKGRELLMEIFDENQLVFTFREFLIYNTIIMVIKYNTPYEIELMLQLFCFIITKWVIFNICSQNKKTFFSNLGVSSSPKILR